MNGKADGTVGSSFHDGVAAQELLEWFGLTGSRRAEIIERRDRWLG